MGKRRWILVVVSMVAGIAGVIGWQIAAGATSAGIIDALKNADTLATQLTGDAGTTGYGADATRAAVPFLGTDPTNGLKPFDAFLGKFSGALDAFDPKPDDKIDQLKQKIAALSSSIGPNASLSDPTFSCSDCEAQNLEWMRVTLAAHGTIGGAGSTFTIPLGAIEHFDPQADPTKSDPKVKASLEWNVSVQIYVDTNGVQLQADDTAGHHELTLKADVTLETGVLNASLGALRLRMEPVGTPGFHGTLTVDFPGSDLTSPSFGFENAGVDAHWALSATTDSPLLGVSSTLDIVWNLSGDFSTSGLSVDIGDIQLDASQFMGHTLTSAASQIRDLVGPIATAVEPLTAPLPVLSDLGHQLGVDEVSLLTIAEQSGVSPDLGKAIQRIIRLNDGLKLLTNEGKIALGSVHLAGEAVQKNATPNIEKLQALLDECSECKTVVNEFKKIVNGPEADGGGDGGMSFQFPVLDHPETLAGLLLGRDVDLFTFDTGQQGDKKTINVPLFKILIFEIKLKGDVEAFIHLKGGLDTAGIREAMADPDAGLDELLNGLYLVNAGGPSVKASSDIGIAPCVGVDVVEACVVTAPNININLTVPENTRLRPYVEGGGIGCALLQPAGTADFALQVRGEIVMPDPLPNIKKTLATYVFLTAEDICDPNKQDVPVAYVDGGVLHILKGSDRNLKDGVTDAIRVYGVHNADGVLQTIVVTANGGVTKEFDAAGINSVMYASTGDPRPVNLRVLNHDGHPFELPTSVYSGTGDDNLVLQLAVNAPGYVDAGPGNDSVLGGNGSDTLYGGDNDDVIGGGAGNDQLHGGNGADSLSGDDGDDRLEGEANDDLLVGGSGKNTLIGAAGGDTITGGPDDDRIFTATETETGIDAVGPDDAGATKDNPNLVFTGTGNDRVWGGAGVDFVNGQSQPDQKVVVIGGGGNDALTGGFGSDEVYGGPGDDYVLAEPATVGSEGDADTVSGVAYGPKRIVKKLALPDGIAPNTKLLVGGLGNDHIIGGDGNSTIFGDKYLTSEACAAGAPVPSDPIAESTSAGSGDGNDLIIGGAGVDTVSAGGGDDLVFANASGDLVCGQQGNDKLNGEENDDQMWGGTGDDILSGGSGSDQLFGNAGDDAFSGGNGDDIIEGNNGADIVHAGANEDTVYGGTRLAGRDDTDVSGVGGTAKGDQLFGDAGNDVVIGDNGSTTDPYPYDLDGSKPNAGAGDQISGGTGTDTLYGGIGNDTINGDNDNDVVEGNNGSDTIHGGANEDVLYGGSTQQPSSGTGRPDMGDTIYGDDGSDLIAGDNAVVSVVADPTQATRVTLYRGFGQNYKVQLLDLGDTPNVAAFGSDDIDGGGDADVIFGQNGADRLKGGAGDDYADGGPGSDWIEGDAGDDDLTGGSSTMFSGAGEDTRGQPDTNDAIFGGPGGDVILGDNGVILRPSPTETPTRSTVRMSSTAGVPLAGRIIQMYDRRNGGSYLTAAPSTRFGSDRISGGAGVDVMYGQDGVDYLSGGPDDDYMEGNGSDDVIRGDALLSATSSETAVVQLTDPGWPGTASDATSLEGSGTDGQDDIIGGNSTPGFRDGNDVVEGDGGADHILGDGGSLMRTLETVNGVTRDKVYAERYPRDALPSDATRSRIADPDKGPSTRFCTTTQATCEVSGAFGADTLYGDAGEDTMYGQDGADVMSGGGDADIMYGELGDDRMFGDPGADAMLGDRGGVTLRYLNVGDTPAPLTVTLQEAPMETFTGFRTGTVHAFVDLLHDVNGNQFAASSASTSMPHPGLTEGGKDRMRGGTGNDNMHGAFGDDLVNGDSGGDILFGDDGADVLWGGKGCDAAVDSATADCLLNGTFNPDARGTNDRFVDHTFGGQGEDILDWDPRGSYPSMCAPGTTPTTGGTRKDPITMDPCSWFEMTNKNDADASNNQHHQGTDWIYGGWDRDIMQGDVAGNGPNPGDRLIDWTGAYNLYSHCPAAYGGYNDIRLFAPDLRDFLTGLAWTDGAGQVAADATTSGRSGFRELAFTYNEDINTHGNGSAFPSSPGHFDDPQACTN